MRPPRAPGARPLAAALLALALAFPSAGPLAAGPAAAPVQGGEAEDGGIRIRWSYAPAPGEEGLGTLSLEIGDAAGQPTGHGTGQVMAWLQRRRGALSDAETSCSDKVGSLLTQGLGRRADIDLNEYRLVTLNSDGSLAFINPFVGLNNAKLESILDLRAAPRAWVQLPDRLEAWAVTDDPARLLRIDLQARRITADLALPGAPAPEGLAYDAAAGRLWVALPGADRLGVVDPAPESPRLDWLDAPGLAGVVALGGGRDADDGAGDGGRGVLALYRDGRVAFHDGSAAPKTWATGGTPVAAGWSALSRRIILATAEGDLLWLDPAAPAGPPAHRLALGHAVSHLAVFDGGRRAIVLGPDGGGVIDLASARRVTTLAGAAGADGILMSRNFAYATRSRDGRAVLWALADLRAGRDRPAEVITGSPAPGALGARAGGRAVVDPGGEGILVASPADGLIFRYSEGMMAPSGSYSNYRRAALGLMVLDLSLRQTGPGRFRGTIRHDKGGAYDLVLAGVGPRFSACGRVVLAPPAGQPPPVERITRAVLLDSRAAAGAQSLRLRLDRTEEGRTWPLSGLRDLTLLVFDRHSGWQRRVPARETAPGEYEARLPLPRPAAYDVLVSSPSADLSYGEGRLGALRLGAGP